MIKLIEVRNYRSLKYISQSLANFNVLIGANATGKSTFLDSVKFMADIVEYGVEKAVFERARNFEELTFGKNGNDIEFAIECEIPQRIAMKFEREKKFTDIRYELKIGALSESNSIGIKHERVVLLKLDAHQRNNFERSLFPQYLYETDIKLISNQNFRTKFYKQVISKKIDGNDNFYIETSEKTSSGWIPSFKLGPKRSALGNLPDDETKFPASAWLKSFLLEGVQLFILNSLSIRKPSPPGQGVHFKSDGSNLPWVIDHLKKNDINTYYEWIAHIKTALKDIKSVDTKEREEDRHRYITVEYQNGVEVPSWLVSDGTLRLMALTIPAYINVSGVYLIEEPENGIHPRAIECVYQSLSSVYSAQIMLASHSSVILSIVAKKDLLCFGKTQDGITDIVAGNDHPQLISWRGNPNLSVIYAGGILS